MGTGLSLLSQSAQEDATVRVLEELVGVGVAVTSGDDQNHPAAEGTVTP